MAPLDSPTMTTGHASERVHVERFEDPARFLEAAIPFLVTREAEHNLILGIASNLVVDPGRVVGPPYLALARRTGTPVPSPRRDPVPRYLSLQGRA